jgi:Tannase and feruloyl esterase
MPPPRAAHNDKVGGLASRFYPRTAAIRALIRSIIPWDFAAGAAFGLDPQARRDYGYSGDITPAPIAQAIIAAHYGRKPDFSYMFGCSNGGRHTMVAAIAPNVTRAAEVDSRPCLGY